MSATICNDGTGSPKPTSRIDAKRRHGCAIAEIAELCSAPTQPIMMVPAALLE
jgi:hypothetical protein